MKQFFSYDNEGDGMTFHDTSEEAVKAAAESLSRCREDAPDGWPDGVEWIGWGEVHGWVEETKRETYREHLISEGETPEDADDAAPYPFDEWVEYELRRPEKTQESKS